jgi:hypothetical protein
VIVAKGYEVGFLRRPGSRVQAVKPPRSYALLHDPSGADWPRNSLLVAPIHGRGEVGRGASYGPAIEYFGYEPVTKKLHIPLKDIREWNLVCNVHGLDYWRPGVKYEGEYEHDFKGRGWTFEKVFPKLYRRGRVYRLELGPGAIVNWRGIVFP